MISDGVKTEGSLTTLLDELKSQDIAVDVFPVDYEYANEVWIERLELPRNVKMGESYEASVILSSLRAGEAVLLPNNGFESTAMHSVFCAADTTTYAVSLAVRGTRPVEPALSRITGQ